MIRQADGINQVHYLTPEGIGAILSQAGEVGSSWRGCGTNLRNVFIFLWRVTVAPMAPITFPSTTIGIPP